MTVTDRVRSSAHDLSARARGLLDASRHGHRPAGGAAGPTIGAKAAGVIDRVRRARRPE